MTRATDDRRLWWRQWPACTVRACTHNLTHPTPAAAETYQVTHPGLVNPQTGRAVCVCHPPHVATLAEVTRFPCDERRR